MWPTKEQSRFYGDRFAVEFYGPTGEEVERSIKRTSAAGQAAQSAGRAKWRKMVINPLKAELDGVTSSFGTGDGPVLAVADAVDRAEPAPSETKPAEGVFAALATEAVRVAADPEARRDEEMARNSGQSKANNNAAVAVTWGDADTRVRRMTRESVEVTLPSGEVRSYKSVREAFELLRFDVKKHIRFRQKLKETRAETFAAHAFRLVPRP